MTGYQRGYMYAPEPPEEEPEGGWGMIVFYLAIAAIGLTILAGIFAFVYAGLGPQDPEPRIEKQIVYTNYYPEGDDNRDGHIDETESGWNCETMGNKVCGPDEHRMRLS
jgi:hypothetical protein